MAGKRRWERVITGWLLVRNLPAPDPQTGLAHDAPRTLCTCPRSVYRIALGTGVHLLSKEQCLWKEGAETLQPSAAAS